MEPKRAVSRVFYLGRHARRFTLARIRDYGDEHRIFCLTFSAATSKGEPDTVLASIPAMKLFTICTLFLATLAKVQGSLRGNDAVGDARKLQATPATKEECLLFGLSPDLCVCVFDEGNSFEYCGCVDQGQPSVICDCIKDGFQQEYCGLCLQSLASSEFDLNNLNRYAEWFSATTRFNLAQTGTYFVSETQRRIIQHPLILRSRSHENVPPSLSLSLS